MSMYHPNYIGHYGERFIRLGLSAHGVSFEQYLAAPERYEIKYENEYRPLLPAQRAVQARLDAISFEVDRVAAEVDELPHRNGVAIEPLRHHCRPKRSRKSDFTRRLRTC
tara:strand:- start:34092 stop:34421 length:330 start_codon:yes stop_codon:yes gene_type:complete